jgi:hypothetical protein
MSVSPGRGRPRSLALVLGLYAAAALGTPLLHHDLACHLKTPTHCDACMANPLGSRAESSVEPAPPRFLAAGRVPARSAAARETAPRRATRDRSPPR